MAPSHRYIRTLAWAAKSPRVSMAPVVPPLPAGIRLAPGLVLALVLSALFALATILLLVRSWLIDAPAPEADRLVALGVGGITWLTSLGYYALWQLDKQLRPPSARTRTFRMARASSPCGRIRNG